MINLLVSKVNPEMKTTMKTKTILTLFAITLLGIVYYNATVNDTVSLKKNAALEILYVKAHQGDTTA
jgi:hypothetical protein